MRPIRPTKIWFDYLLIGMLFQFTLVPFWFGNRYVDLIQFLIIASVFIKRVGLYRVNKKVFLLFIIHSGLALAQGLYWDYSILSIVTSFSFLVLNSYFLWEIYGKRFFELFENVFRFFAIISLVLWVGIQIYPFVKDVINQGVLWLFQYSGDEWPRSFIFITHWYGLDDYFLGLTRNSGPLHEPGGFATVLVFFLSYNYSKGERLSSMKNLFYLVCLITTFSTSGYLSLSLVLMVFIGRRKHVFIKSLAIVLVIFVSFYFYKNIDFLEDKISIQIEEQMDKPLDEPTSGRFYGLRKSLYVAFKYPLLGRGINTISMPEERSHPEYLGYGWFSIVFRYGLVFGLLYFFYFAKGFINFFRQANCSLFDSFLLFFATLINLSSQVYLGKPLFFMFFIIGIGIIPFYQLRRPIYYPIQTSNLKNP